MRRLFGPLAAEVVLPVLAALAIGVVVFFAVTPRTSGQQADGGLVRIYVSVPLHQFASIVKGAQMARDEANSRAGTFRVELVPLNDAPALGGKWSADVELANARRAVADPDAMAYIGTYNS